MVKRLFIAVSLVLAYAFVYDIKLAYAQAGQPTIPFPNEQQTIEGSKAKLTPLMLQNELEENKCTGLKSLLNSLLDIFACNSEQYQNINMPSALTIQGKAAENQQSKVEGIATALTEEGEVKGLTTFVTDLLKHASTMLGGEQEGAMNKYFPESLKSKIAQSGKPADDIPKVVKQAQCMNLPVALQKECGKPTNTWSSVPEDLPSGTTAAPADSLNNLFVGVERWLNIPWQVVAGIAKIEGAHLFTYSDAEIRKYSQAGAQDPINCQPNECAAAGPMQFTTGGANLDIYGCATSKKWVENWLASETYRTRVDAEAAARNKWPNKWAGHKDAVNQATGEGRTPNVCNIKDAIYATGSILETTRKIKDQYCKAGNTYSSYCCAATDNWNDSNLVKCAAGSYYGNCATTYAFLGNKTYCDFVWDYYQQRKNDVVEPIAKISSEQLNQAPQGRYVMNYQQGAPYGSMPLPGNTSYTVNNAGCGPMTAFNALSNFDQGFNTGFRDFLYRYYPNVDENGLSVEEGRTILEQFGFSTEYIYRYYQEGATKELYEMIGDFNYNLNNGWQGIWVNALFWSERKQALIGHHLLVVEVRGSDVYALDPYYGYGNPIPMRLNDLHPKIRNAFVFRKL